MAFSTESWHYLTSQPAGSGVFKQHPEDFVVIEDLGYPLTGEGEHQFILVEKVNANTAFVAEALAKFTGLPLRAVSYAGRKDKYALTRQWFGLHAPGKADFDFSTLDLEGVKVLSQTRHNKKLKTGQLKGNRFEITLRQVTQPEDVIARFETAATQGVPNYFGEQRFGVVRQDENGERQEGGNLILAERMAQGEVIRNRNKRSMALSALRSFLFNHHLSARIEAKLFHTAVPGDALMLTGSNSFFIHDGSDSTVKQRYADKDLAPSAPLWGAGKLATSGVVAAFEQDVADRFSDAAAFLADAGLKQERRTIKIWPQNLEWHQQGDTLTFCFSLPSGCFATSVLRECIHTLAPHSGPSISESP